MATYISLLNFTQQGIQAIKDSPKRVEAYIKAAKAAGVKTVSVHYTMGQYDLVLISEAADEDALMKVLLKQLSLGYVTACTMKAFTPSQMREFLKEPE